MADNDTLGRDTKQRGHDGRLVSPRDSRMPYDLMRSRRVGLVARVCSRCGAFKDQGHCDHEKGCPAGPYDEVRITTGPMKPDQTSNDTGWRLLS